MSPSIEGRPVLPNCFWSRNVTVCLLTCMLGLAGCPKSFRHAHERDGSSVDAVVAGCNKNNQGWRMNVLVNDFQSSCNISTFGNKKIGAHGGPDRQEPSEGHPGIEPGGVSPRLVVMLACPVWFLPHVGVQESGGLQTIICAWPLVFSPPLFFSIPF